jgi:peroxiredoxin
MPARMDRLHENDVSLLEDRLIQSRTTLPLLTLSLVGGLLLYPAGIRGQTPVSVGQTMPDFTLPAVQGGQVTLSALRGKNVLLIFPRGRSGGGWCHVCHYQYAELAEFDEMQGMREQHNLEVLFVLPYDRDVVQEWVTMFPAQLQDIENWKNPPDEADLDERQRNRMEVVRRYYPKKFEYEPGNIPIPFPVLIDADQAFSQRLGLFTSSWGGAEVEQNVPTIFIVDGDGVVQFKYHSQSTVDRPGPDYLQRVMEDLVKGG